MSNISKLLSIIVFLFLLVSCKGEQSEIFPKLPGKWYTQSQVDQGKILYQTNCIACHGVAAGGIVQDWRQPLKDGSYPPPPLNGTAHAWHHPKKALVKTIKNGGIAIGGKMPAFKGKVDEHQIDAIIAYFQSQWPDSIYKKWATTMNR